jgi:hypothetical protein
MPDMAAFEDLQKVSYSMGTHDGVSWPAVHGLAEEALALILNC